MRIPKILILATVFFSGCNSNTQPVENLYSLPEGYQLEKVSKVKLPEELKEISGIFWKEDFIWAVDDEYGDLFQIDPKSGEIKTRVKFGKDQDYEDLAILGDTAWVLQSNGDLHRVTNFLQNNPQTEVFEFSHKGKKDFETLVQKPGQNSLLIICKNCEWDKKGESSVFEFDLTTEAFKENPVQTLKFDEVAGMESVFSEQKPTMEPSASAIHPITGDLFILSSAGKWLLVTSPTFSPKSVHALDPKLFEQPEGISFDPNGNLFISNEGQNKKPNLLSFPISR